MPLARLRPAEPDSDAADTSAAEAADGAEGGGVADVEVPAVLHDPSMPDFVPTEEFQQVLPGAVTVAEAPAYLVRCCVCSLTCACAPLVRVLHFTGCKRHAVGVLRPCPGSHALPYTA